MADLRHDHHQPHQVNGSEDAQGCTVTPGNEARHVVKGYKVTGAAGQYEDLQKPFKNLHIADSGNDYQQQQTQGSQHAQVTYNQGVYERLYMDLSKQDPAAVTSVPIQEESHPHATSCRVLLTSESHGKLPSYSDTSLPAAIVPLRGLSVPVNHSRLKSASPNLPRKPIADYVITAGHIRNIEGHVGKKFRELGRGLGLTDVDLEAVELDHRGFGTKEVVHQMLMKWIGKKGSKATISVLVRALKRADLAPLCSVIGSRISSVKDLQKPFQNLHMADLRHDHHQPHQMKGSEDAQDRAPAEILARPEALQAYREAIKSGKKAVFRTRVMFVGQERVGKTSLRKRLMGEKFDDNEISTDGIEASADCRIDVHQTTSWTVHQDTKDQYTDALAEDMARQLKETRNISQSEQPPDETLQTPTSSGPTDSNQRASDNTEEQRRKAEQVRNFRLKLSDREVPVLHVPDHVSKILAEKMEDEAEDNNGREITFSLWDFAGQELYYTTHQVFLTRRTIYVIVVNLMDDFSQTIKEQTVPTALHRLDFWLQSIYTFCDLTKAEESDDCDQLSPPIFIVGTHRNSLGDTEEECQQQVGNKFDSILQSFKGKCYRKHVVTEYFDVENSLEGDERISKLKEKMREVMKKEPYMGEEIPLRWLQFEDSVKQEAAKRDKNNMCVDIEEVKQLSGAREIPDESTNEFTTMLQFYHDLGTIMYHPTAKSTLQKKVILNPHWLVDIFRRVITVPDKKKAKNLESWERLGNEGILEDKLINLMWKDFIGNDGQSKEKKSALLELMKTYDLLVEKKQCHPNQQQSETERLYYVPSRLSKEMDAEDDNGDVDSRSTVFYVDFKGFLPVGFFHRTMVRAVDWSQKQCGVEPGVEPKLLYRKATFYADTHHNFKLEMMPNKQSLNKEGKVILLSLIKVVISREEVFGNKAASRDDVDRGVFHKVKEFLSDTFKDLKSIWARGIDYKFCLACPCRCTFCKEQDKRVCSCSSVALHFFQLDLDKCLNCTKSPGNPESVIRLCIMGKRVSIKSLIEWYADVKQEENLMPIPWNDLEFGELLGQGGEGTVNQGIWRKSGDPKGHAVAIKHLLNSKECQELKALSKLQHPNIIHIHGYHENTAGLFIVMELCPHGSLKAYLRSQDVPLVPKRLLDWISQSACAIQYLKHCGIVHKDIKTDNFVISSAMILKLADFGISKDLDTTLSSATATGTWRWMAPEIHEERHLSPSSDIFSLALVWWSMVTRQLPYDELKSPFFQAQAICQGKRPVIPPDCRPELADLMKCCWDQDRTRRPNIDYIVATVETMKASQR